MPKRKTERIAEVRRALESGKLTLGVELPADPSASKDWADDDETTSIGPVDDMQPIGRVTPVPDVVTEPHQHTAACSEPTSPCYPPYSEADEEPTLLGPNPTITEDDGEPDYAPGVPTQWQVGIDWGTVKRVEFIDLTAIALYGRGFPVQNCYTKAKLLWEQRCKEGIR